MNGGALKLLESRRPVWLALSEVFLDTELQEDDLRRIAPILAASGSSLSELEHVLWAEVAPVVGWNLFSVAGVWDGFDPAWLEEGLLRGRRRGRLSRALRLTAKLSRHLWESSIGADWERVKSLLPQDDAPA